jgi:hypothetical protein
MGSLFLTQKIDKKEDKVSPHFTYHQDYKKTKVFCGISCSIKDWDTDNKKVKRSDKNFKLKNLQIDTLRTKLETIVNRYKNNDEILSAQQLKLELKKREIVKKSTSISSLPLYNLIKDWLNDYMSNEVILQSTRNKTKQMARDIFDFIEEREKENETLLVDDLNQDFARDFMVWLFNKEYTRGDEVIVGLSPNSVSRRFVALNIFCKWYSRVSKEYIKVDKPSELKKSVSIIREEDKPFLKNDELQKVYNFNSFNYLKPIAKNGEIEWVENKEYHKYLKLKGDTKTKNKDGIVELMFDKTKYGLQTYTTYEVYKDLFVFLCSVGCRYSDGIRMKLGNFYHAKRSSTSTLEDGVEAYFKFYQKKTNRDSIPRVNEVSYEIYKKYSRGKTKDDYLFPLTENGNFISDVKFNKHIKKICKIIGLNRPFIERRVGISGKEIESKTKKLHEVIKSHVGRRTFIYNMVMDGNYTTEELKVQTGHKKTDVFNSYFKLKEEIHKKPNTPFLKLHKNVIERNDEVEEIGVETFEPQQYTKSLKEKLKELEDVKDDLDEKEYNFLRNKIIKNAF